MHFLLVDDNAEITKIMSKYFTKKGHMCTVTNDGRNALEILQGQKFDATLLDLAMPEFSGRDVVMHLKNNGKINDHNIVCLTASSPSGEYEDELRIMGVKAILKKPIDPDVLLDFMNQFQIKH
ncbi:Response regulator receiver protein [Nitrosarchaeum koreense MY1]|uniref:Response regulator receiver protein n=1 Tax=Nitrosarchaeum koreense MY1 TaxID=1001994 RepID=F9CW22_9ARCH|nr:Response regulator receiver protein [Nitrosarchaeum koreense MY1]